MLPPGLDHQIRFTGTWCSEELDASQQETTREAWWSIDTLLDVDSDLDASLVAEVQRRIRAGDVVLAHALASIAFNPQDADRSALALEILAGARATRFDALVALIILKALMFGGETLKLAAIAAVGDLPRRLREDIFQAFLRTVAEATAEPDSVRAAAKAALG